MSYLNQADLPPTAGPDTGASTSAEEGETGVRSWEAWPGGEGGHTGQTSTTQNVTVVRLHILLACLVHTPVTAEAVWQ